METSRLLVLSFLYRSVRQITFSANAICHQNPREIEYPPMPSRQLSPNAVTVGILGIIWAMGVSQKMPDKEWSFLPKNSISCLMVLLIWYLYFEWCTNFAACFIAKEICLAWSLQGALNNPVFKEIMISQNSREDSSRRHLFSEKVCAIDAKKWERRWKTQVSPSARWPSLSVSFCAFNTVNCFRPACQVMFNSFKTSCTYRVGMPMVSLYVLARTTYPSQKGIV